MRRAKAQLRIKSERCGDQWFWSLPNQPQDAQDEQSPAAELQGAQAQGAHAPDAPAQDAHALADLAQDAHGQDTQGAQDAQDQPTKRNRIITIKRHGEAQGPNEMSWAEFEAIGCDQTRVREYVKQRDQQQKEESAHAEA